MAYEIFAVKLHELDEKIRKMHSRIHLCESVQYKKLTDEIKALRQECEETERMLSRELKFSCAKPVAKIFEAYTDIWNIIKKTKEELFTQTPASEELANCADEKILMAEYVLDFAVQGANYALLVSMEAIDAQTAQQEREDCKL